MRSKRKSFAIVIFSVFSFTVLVAAPTTNRVAIAHSTPVSECYAIKASDSPAAMEIDRATLQIWCYRNVERPEGARLVYHVDNNGRTKPERSFLVERDGTISHVSILAGERSVHRLRAAWNPMAVPLDPPQGAERVKAPIAPMGAGDDAEGALQVLTSSEANFEDISIRSPGEFIANVAPESMPWRGYWFPHSSGRLHHGSNSPTAKLDRMILGRTGKRGRAQGWEAANHEYTGLNWAGHCNGWAAASVLRKEPRAPWTDPISGVTLSVADQKGILIERDYCPDILFFGKRNNGEGSGNGDIKAVDFHNVLSYYIGRLGKPVLMDYMSTAPVENRAVSGYRMSIEADGHNGAESVYKITATLIIHSYDTEKTDAVGVAPYIEREYRYRLWTTPNGTAIRGQWLSSNPDFFWIAMAPGSCRSGNPYVTEAWAQVMEKPVNFPGW